MAIMVIFGLSIVTLVFNRFVLCGTARTHAHRWFTSADAAI
jgi:hypothetical protein